MSATETTKGTSNVDRIDYFLPEPWAAVDLTADLATQTRAVAERLVEPLTGPDRVRALGVISSLIDDQVAALVRVGARHLLIEADPVGGVRTGTFLAVFPGPPLKGEDPLQALLAIASRTPGAVVLEAGALVVLRTIESQDRTAEIGDGIDAASRALGGGLPGLPEGTEAVTRRLTYYLVDPERPDSWLLVSGSVTTRDDEPGAALAQSLVAVCDAVVETVRFL